jgi:hypothetical protein
MNIRLIAVQAGDALKYDTSVNEIERVGSGVFPFRDEFPEYSTAVGRERFGRSWLSDMPKNPVHRPSISEPSCAGCSSWHSC